MTVVAFAGHGAIHRDNVVALLNDYFGIEGEDADGYPIWPGDDRPTIYYLFDKTLADGDGFVAAFDYSEYADLDFYPIIQSDVLNDPSVKNAVGYTDNPPDVTDDLTETLVRYLKDRGTLIVLWGNEDETDTPTQELVEVAIAADIPVLDLTAGLDSIAFGDAQKDSEPVEVKEPTRTPTEMVEEAQELTQPQDEAQQVPVPDHLRVDHATQQDAPVWNGPNSIANDLIETLIDNLYPIIRRQLIADGFQMQPLARGLVTPEGEPAYAVPPKQDEGDSVPTPLPAVTTKTRGRPRKEKSDA